jgi:hypothetical protein
MSFEFGYNEKFLRGGHYVLLAVPFKILEKNMKNMLEKRVR